MNLNLEILKSLAENTNDETAYQKLLFAEDSARGFAFIELCRQKYDVIVMNPPFNKGAKFLLKAYDCLNGSGQLVCLLNAETINNLFSNN
jgi:16S rRNA G1207 methylase RsmC